MKNTTNNTIAISIFVTNLSAYVGGALVGEWLTLPATDNEIAETLHNIGDPEEFFISDYNAPDGMHIGEYENIYKLNELAAAINDEDSDIIAAYLEAVSDDLEEALENADNCILYSECETLEDLAAELVEEGCFGNIPDSIINYIDYEAIARDLGFDCYVETSRGVLYYGN
jgi:antirestriction protein